MFFFGTKKDRYYEIAQRLFTVLADSAPDDWKGRVLLQRDLMKRAKLCNFDSALALFFQRLPDESKRKMSISSEYPFASVRMKKAEKEFYADFNLAPDGTICAIQFTFFPKDGVFDVIDVDFYPDLLEQSFRAKSQDAPFRISEKLILILGPEWDREFALQDDDSDTPEFSPAPPPERRDFWRHTVHTELPDDWREFSQFFSELVYHDAVVYGCTEEMQLIPMHPGDNAMYLVARIPNAESDIDESYVLASSDKDKWNTLYFLADYDGGETDCVPIGTDLFSFIRKAENPAFPKSLKKD